MNSKSINSAGLALLVVCAFFTSNLQAEQADGLLIPNGSVEQQAMAEQIANVLQAYELLIQAGEVEAANKLMPRLQQLQEELRMSRKLKPQIGNIDAMALTQLKEMAHSVFRQNEKIVSELAASREEIQSLKKSINELRAIVEEQLASKHDEMMSHVDLNGTWEMTLPGGSISKVELLRTAQDLWKLKTGTVLGGIYQHTGSNLKVVVPNDQRLTEFLWTIRDPNTLLLVESSTKTGSDYRGAIMHRLEKPAAEVFETPDPMFPDSIRPSN